MEIRSPRTPFRANLYLTLNQVASHCGPSGVYALKLVCESYLIGLRSLVVDRLVVDQDRLLSGSV
jgi:hypothetical protein